MIEKFAASTGARIIQPSEDLSSREKAVLTKGKQYDNDHQRDSLACAIMAFNELRPLIEKINKRTQHQEIRKHLTKTVIKKRISIDSAMEMLAEKPVPKVEMLIKKQPVLIQSENLDLKELNKTNQLLKKHNQKLVRALNKLKTRLK